MSDVGNDYIDTGAEFLNFDEKIYNKLLELQKDGDDTSKREVELLNYFTINPLGYGIDKDYSVNDITILYQGSSSIHHTETLDETKLQNESVEIIIRCVDYNDNFGQYNLLKSIARYIHKIFLNQSNPKYKISGVSNIDVDTIIPTYQKDLSNRVMTIDLSGITTVGYKFYSKTYKDIMLMLKMRLTDK